MRTSVGSIILVTLLVAGTIMIVQRQYGTARPAPVGVEQSGILPSNPTGGPLWDSAASLWERGQYDSASTAFETGEVQHPRDAAWPQALAECMGMLGRHQETLDALQRCEAIAALSPEAKDRRRRSHLEIGFAKAGSGDPWTARQHADAVLQGHPDDSMALLLQGYGWAMEGATPKAADALEKLVGTHPGLKEAYPILIQCAFQRGNAANAKRWIGELARLDPRFPGLDALRNQASQLENGRGAYSSRLRVVCDGSCPLGVEREILEVGERAWGSLSRDLGRAPTAPVSIRLEASGAMPTEWAAALFDGQVRLPLDLAEQSDRRYPVILHELAHAFLLDLSGGRIPLWMNEGLAQWLAGDRPRSRPEAKTASWLDEIPNRRQFLDLTSDEAELAYAYSLAVTNELMSLHGSTTVVRYLELLAGGAPEAESFETTFGRSYRSLSERIRARM